jgi:hypothetical protein
VKLVTEFVGVSCSHLPVEEEIASDRFGRALALSYGIPDRKSGCTGVSSPTKAEPMRLYFAEAVWIEWKRANIEEEEEIELGLRLADNTSPILVC